MTETYHVGFYLGYLAQWPDIFYVAETPNGRLMSYIMGKCEETKDASPFHGHVTALTVSPEFRRLGLGKKLMSTLEDVSDAVYGAHFVDLFVRSSNDVAIGMYKKLGYVVYRRVLKYYSSGPEEDALDMRKALSRDKNKTSVVPLGRYVESHEVGVV